MKTEVAFGWGVRVGGSLPYLAYMFYPTKEGAEQYCVESYQRPVKVAIVPLGDYKKLLKGEDINQDL